MTNKCTNSNKVIFHFWLSIINSEVRAEKENVRKSEGGSVQALLGFTIIQYRRLICVEHLWNLPFTVSVCFLMPVWLFFMFSLFLKKKTRSSKKYNKSEETMNTTKVRKIKSYQVDLISLAYLKQRHNMHYRIICDTFCSQFLLDFKAGGKLSWTTTTGCFPGALMINKYIHPAHVW